jgi:hypothetical protein
MDSLGLARIGICRSPARPTPSAKTPRPEAAFKGGEAPTPAKSAAEHWSGSSLAVMAANVHIWTADDPRCATKSE